MFWCMSVLPFVKCGQAQRCLKASLQRPHGQSGGYSADRHKALSLQTLTYHEACGHLDRHKALSLQFGEPKGTQALSRRMAYAEWAIWREICFAAVPAPTTNRQSGPKVYPAIAPTK